MFELIRGIAIDLPEARATGIAELPADHPSLADHFPGRPLLPGTWLVELAAQIAGPLAEEVTRARHAVDRWAVLAMIRNAKLLAPVELPATLELVAALVDPDPRAPPATVIARTTARAGKTVILRGELVFALIEAPPGSEQAIAERHARLARWTDAGAGLRP